MKEIIQNIVIPHISLMVVRAETYQILYYKNKTADKYTHIFINTYNLFTSS